MYRLKLTVLIIRHNFYNLVDIFVIFYKAICISYAGRTSLRDYEQSLFFMSPSSETREARKQRVISLCHLKCNIYSIISKLTIDLTLNYVKIFKFQNGSTKKLFYKQSLSLNVRPRVLKSPQSRSL